MSREIKFRDWNPEAKEMQYFNLDGYDREVHDAYGNIMQFTGLLDKNGKEIFESDVIKIIMKDCVLLDEVYWSESDAMFCLKKLSRNMLTLQTHNVEIVGNIYQNPELLGGENE